MKSASELLTASAEAVMGEILDEVLERLQRGERPDIEEYAQRYPQLATVLRQMLPALELMRQSASGSAGATGATPGIEPEAPLGDYRIVREIGRGGMGVVYEAVQISLGRRVALKVLPFASTLDAKQLQRFKNEAQAAAHLHHTNIVPVFATGCERGVHYYAMQFIEGPTLAAVIADLRGHASEPRPSGTGPSARDAKGVAHTRPYLLPGQLADARGSASSATPPVAALSTERSTKSPAFFRTAAQLGVQAAEALEHAHQFGIVHRDIKPANLLLETGAGGAGVAAGGAGVPACPRLWITDFGLAHCQSQAGLTMTGDLLGTLRYMSPEQALAKRVIVDHRTDIYSLGVTLYELLTLEPAFNGQDRQELLRQIAFEEAKPARRLNKSIPAELETIVLKAMAKNPDERYGTAQELADDLRRFLEDKPIWARRATLVQRARKWLRRHNTVVTTAVLVALLALTVGVGLLWQEHRRTLAERDRATANLQVALRALNDVYVRFVEQRLPREAELDEEDRKLLEGALALFEEFAQQDHADQRLRLEKGRAYRRVGTIQKKLGHIDKAEAAYQQSVAILEELVSQFPADREYRAALAESYHHLGNLVGTLGRFQESVQLHLRAGRLVEELGADCPDQPAVRSRLAMASNDLGNELESAGRLSEAEEAYRKALACLERLVAEFPSEVWYQSQLAATVHNLAYLRWREDKLQAARELLERSVRLQQAAVKERPRGEPFRVLLRNHYQILFDILVKQGEQAAALELLRRSCELQAQLVADYPGVPRHRRILAQSYVSLGKLLHEADRLDEAVQVYQRALDLRSQLHDEFPNDADLRRRVLAPTHFNLANFLVQAGRYETVARHHRRALELDPGNAVFANELAWFLVNCPDVQHCDPAQALPLARQATDADPGNGVYWRTLGAAQSELKDWRAAISAIERTMQLLSGGEGYDWLILAEAHWQLGNKAEARKWYDQAAAWIDKNAAEDKDLRRFCAETAKLLGVKEKEE